MCWTRPLRWVGLTPRTWTRPGSRPCRGHAQAFHARPDGHPESHLRSGCEALLHACVVGCRQLGCELTCCAGWSAAHQHTRRGKRRKVRCRPGPVTCQNCAGQQESRDGQDQHRCSYAKHDQGRRTSLVGHASPDARLRPHCTSPLTAPALSLHQPSHCTSPLTAPALSLHQPSHCKSPLTAKALCLLRPVPAAAHHWPITGPSLRRCHSLSLMARELLTP